MVDEAPYKRSYKTGSRRPDLNKTPGRMSEVRAGWTTNEIGQFVIMIDGPSDTEYGENIRVFHPIPKRPGVMLDLTRLTEEELTAMKHLFDTAFEWAKPIVKKRDKEAQDAFDAGDDSFFRIYRAVPQLVYRSSPKPEHGEGVHDRPSDDDAVEQPSRDSDSRNGNSLDDVAQRDSDDSESEDDQPSTD